MSPRNNQNNYTNCLLIIHILCNTPFHRTQTQEYDMSPAELAALEAVLTAHGEVIPAIAIPERG